MALRIVDLSTVWLDAQAYAQDLPFIKLGQEVTAKVEGVPGRNFKGKVVFIHPQVDPQTRTATVRMALPNQELSLRPGLYATAQIESQIADEALLVPREAILDTGTRQVVFIAEGEGHFSPRRISTASASADGMVQVVDGLTAGEAVVTSGQFLLDAESRMREAIQKHLRERMLADAPVATTNTAAPAMPQPDHADHSTVAATPPAHIHGAALPPATARAPAPQSSAEADKVLSEYLKLHKLLGAPQQADTPVDPAGLVRAAEALAEVTTGETRAFALAVRDAAAAAAAKPLSEQRKRFKPLSEAVIALARLTPPSAAVADPLFIAYCPMAPGDGARWLQRTDTVANPYFATSMKDCGTIEGKIELGQLPGSK
jgi:hypothetical protein